MRDLIWHISIIVLIGGAIFFTNLGQARLWDRDEPRNAGCAAEMLERGNWVVPTFNEELRHQKPVLLYWLIMSAYSVLGVNEFSARVWSAGLALVTVLATYGIARRLFNAMVGLLAAIALSTSLMFDVAARAATPDSVLICCSTSAIFLYVIGTFSRKQETPNQNRNSLSDFYQTELKQSKWFPQNIFTVIGMYILMGLGVLAKGPVGFILPMAIIGMFMLIVRLNKQNELEPDVSYQAKMAHKFINWIRPFQPLHFLKTLSSMRPILAAAIVLLVAGPWYWMVASATDGEFIQRFFVGEHFGRATEALENHSGGLWFYPFAILVGFFPWSVLWGPVVVSLWKNNSQKASSSNNRTDVATVLLLCWIGVQVGAFSLAQTKLPSYVTPCYPALAILVAFFLNQLSCGKATVHHGWYIAAFGGLVVTGLAICGGLGFATSKYMPGQSWLALTGLVPVLGGGLLIALLFKCNTQKIPTMFAFTSVLFCWLLFGFGTSSLDHEQENHLVLSEISNETTAVAAYGCLESSWVFYGGQPIHEISPNQADEPEHVDYYRSNKALPINELTSQEFWKAKPPSSVRVFLNQNPGAVFLTSSDHIDELKKRLPTDYEIIQTADYFLKNKKIYLLGQKNRERTFASGTQEYY